MQGHAWSEFAPKQVQTDPGVKGSRGVERAGAWEQAWVSSRPRWCQGPNWQPSPSCCSAPVGARRSDTSHFLNKHLIDVAESRDQCLMDPHQPQMPRCSLHTHWTPLMSSLDTVLFHCRADHVNLSHSSLCIWGQTHTHTHADWAWSPCFAFHIQTWRCFCPPSCFLYLAVFLLSMHEAGVGRWANLNSHVNSQSCEFMPLLLLCLIT